MTSAVCETSTPGATARMRADTLADSVLILMGMTVLQRLVGFTRGVLVCRWMSPEALGQWDLALGFLVLAAPVAILGLPGCFGRYAEYYRRRGQLRTFLGRVTIVTVVLSVIAATAIAIFSEPFSRLVFGNASHQSTVLLMAGCLLLVIAYIFSTELFTALRLYRYSSLLQFLNSLTFATLAVGLLLGWQASVTSMLLAYAGACLLAVVLAVYLAIQVWRDEPAPEQGTPHRTFWGKLIPFAMWVWVANWLTNLFEVADRYVLLHFGSFSPSVALEQVGHYHSARVVPVLLVAVAGLMSSLLLPHLTHDWESGRRQEVVRRVNMTIKLFGLLLVCGGAAVLLAAPWLFQVVFEGKYDGGQAVLPMTLTYCCWLGLAFIAKMYLWCSERAGLTSLSLAVALTANVGLNLLLVPQYGLQGAVTATAAANLVGLGLSFTFAYLCGLRLSLGAWLVPVLPLLYVIGPAATVLGLAVFAAAALLSNRIFTAEEKQDLAAVANQYWSRLRTIG